MDASGNVTTVNMQMATKILTTRVSFDDPFVPLGPGDGVPSIQTLDPGMMRLIERMQACFEARPIWTRRALQNQLRTEEWRTIGKHVYQYVGYMFRSGPWREAVIKYGVDPRKDPRYRVYQTMMFQFDTERKAIKERAKGTERGGARRKGEVPAATNTHIFDGSTVHTDGKVWQVCDISDPFIQQMLATKNIRQECHVSR